MLLYNSKVLGPSLLKEDCARMERVKVLTRRYIIECKSIIFEHIIQIELVAHPFWIDAIFGLVSHLHHVWSFSNVDIERGVNQYQV